ncbi:MAG: PAS domain-containing sensor histidine kinase [Gammaproteobacteria bacterium]|nr:PAS domain-containing sensor histidine kinase [Gammaproteobacteria bacterium]
MTSHNHKQPSAAGFTTDYPALARLRETLSPLCEDNPVAMCITNRKSQIFYANQAFLDLLANRPALNTIQGKALHRLFPQASCRAIERIETLIGAKKSQSLHKILHLGAAPTATAMALRIQMLHNPDDQRIEGALITLQQDADWYKAHFEEEKQTFTARIRQLSTDLMDKRSLVKIMLERSPIGIALLDNQRRVIQINRTAEKILGIPRREAFGLRCNNLFHCFEQGQQCPLLDGGQDIDQQETACAQTGKGHHTFLRSAVRSHERDEDIIIETFIDVTDMIGARQAREEAYRAKDDFFAKMSHELRTPLNAVIGYSELLADEDYPLNPEEQREFAGAIQRGGYDLLHLVDQVLTISRLKENKLESDAQDLHPGQLMDEVAITIRPLADKGHNRFSIRHDDRLGTVYADPEHLRAILLNLLSNACKFTSHGEITLSTQRQAEATRDWVLFRVTDTGIGITEEQAGRIFNRFEQADNSATRSYGGSGLGLSIARDLCEMMGGQIEVQSQPGRGTTFTVRLPGQRPTG